MMVSFRSFVEFLVFVATVAASPVQKKGFNFPPTVRNGFYPLDVVDKLQISSIPNLEAWMAKKSGTTNCTLENAAVRREWSDLSVAEREEYIKAVLCLQSKPAIAPKETVPGAISRYDDFVATHMTMAMMLHDPQHLFVGHKYFLWAYEKALREECGYTGYQPYMNYDRYANDPINSPMFNGNASSMGGNGAPTNYSGIPQPYPKPYDKIPSAGGGGCVTEGPFKDMVVSLGPIGEVVNDIPKNPQGDGLGSNPRCLRRDINRNSALGATANYTYSLIMDNKDVDSFYNRYLGQPYLKGDTHPWGLHNAGHYIIGGDPGGVGYILRSLSDTRVDIAYQDFFASPGDPGFWFHHGMLDRIWWIWQMQDPANRTDAVPGSGAMGMGPMRKRDDIIVDLGWTAPPVPLSELNDQLGGNKGQFCYIYV